MAKRALRFPLDALDLDGTSRPRLPHRAEAFRRRTIGHLLRATEVALGFI